MTTETKVDRVKLVTTIQEIIDASTDSPAAQIQALGNALVKIGKALEGCSISDTRSVIQAVMALQGYSHAS